MSGIAADIIPVSSVTIAPITEAERSASLASLTAVLDRYGGDAVRAPRPAMADISDVLLRAHAHANQPGQAELWSGIPARYFDGTLVPLLRTLGIACREVAAALDSSDAQASRAKLPVMLVQKATAHRARMQRYLDYHLEREPVPKRELDDIRAGTGYLDLESDLRRLAPIATKYATLLVSDRDYAPTDAADARALADEIGIALGTTTGSPSEWVDRLWAAIRRVYGAEVRPTAEWLYRNAPSDLAFYPTIYVGFGRPRGTTTPGDAATEVEPATPALPVTPVTS